MNRSVNVARLNIVRSFKRYLQTTQYKDVFAQSIHKPEEFWSKQAEKLQWHKKWSKALSKEEYPSSLWFPDGQINISVNALDRHIEQGRGKQAAIIFESAYSPASNQILTYEQLHDQVAKFADVLRKEGCGFGIQKTEELSGNVVMIYMANSVEAVIAMLACARIGAPHAVVFGGFAAPELAIRIKHCKPKVIICGSCGIEPKKAIEYKPILDQALSIANAESTRCIIFQRSELKASMNTSRDLDWHEEMHKAKPADPVIVPANHPLYILYTSGTTGQPKGVVRDTAGYAVALNWSMYNIYGINPGDVFWAASDVGWVVGHSYITYGPLLKGCTSVMYEGKPVGTPDAGSFWRLIEKHKVNGLFCAPTAFRAIRREDPEGDFIKHSDLSTLRTLFLAGERGDPDTVKWAQQKFNIPVIDHYWQTETGWPIVSNFTGLGLHPVKPGSASLPVPGYNVQILTDEGKIAKDHQLGSICVKQPLPPGCLVSLYHNKAGLQKSYFGEFPGYYNTGDAGYRDEDGYVFIMTRMGDIINVAGHRLSTGGIEEVLSAHPSVAECAVVGLLDEIKGQVPFAFIVLSHLENQRDNFETIKKECINKVRSHIGAVAAFKHIVIVDKLPKTRSGKILRASLSKIINNEEWTMPATIEDSSTFHGIIKVLKLDGYNAKECSTKY